MGHDTRTVSLGTRGKTPQHNEHAAQHPFGKQLNSTPMYPVPLETMPCEKLRGVNEVESETRFIMQEDISTHLINDTLWERQNQQVTPTFCNSEISDDGVIAETGNIKVQQQDENFTMMSDNTDMFPLGKKEMTNGKKKIVCEDHILNTRQMHQTLEDNIPSKLCLITEPKVQNQMSDVSRKGTMETVITCSGTHESAVQLHKYATAGDNSSASPIYSNPVIVTSDKQELRTLENSVLQRNIDEAKQGKQKIKPSSGSLILDSSFRSLNSSFQNHTNYHNDILSKYETVHPQMQEADLLTGFGHRSPNYFAPFQAMSEGTMREVAHYNSPVVQDQVFETTRQICNSIDITSKRVVQEKTVAPQLTGTVYSREIEKCPISNSAHNTRYPAEQSDDGVHKDNILRLEPEVRSASNADVKQIHETILQEENEYVLPVDKGQFMFHEDRQRISDTDKHPDVVPNEGRNISKLTSVKVKKETVAKERHNEAGTIPVKQNKNGCKENSKYIPVSVGMPRNSLLLDEKAVNMETYSTQTQANGFYCKLCTFKTRHEAMLTRHMIYQHEQHTFPGLCCKECSYSTINVHLLRRHYLTMHFGKWSGISAFQAVKCNICGQVVATEDELIVHNRKAHVNAEDFKCNNCKYVTKWYECLTKHQRTIHGNSEFFFCWKCHQSFYKKIEYYEHQCPNADKKIPCCICMKSYNNPKYLQSHIRRHTITKSRYHCKVCNKSFPRKIELCAHEKSKHEKNRRFDCTKCKSSFMYKSSLNRHIYLAHSDILKQGYDDKNLIKQKTKAYKKLKKVKPFQCPQCQASFAFNNFLKRHLEMKH